MKIQWGKLRLLMNPLQCHKHIMSYWLMAQTKVNQKTYITHHKNSANWLTHS